MGASVVVIGRQGTMSEIHAVFKEYVKGRRGSKIDGNEAKIFEGDFFTGQRAVELGLVDKVEFCPKPDCPLR